jgi:membrane protein required for colicin V production
MTMIWIDFAIIVLIIITLMAGLLRGLNQQAFSLIFWLLAVVVGLNFSVEFSVFLKTTVSHPPARIAASFALLFLITLITGELIGFLLGELVKKAQLTFTDRFGGMLLGVAHGMVAVTVLILLAGLSVLPNSAWWKQSLLIPPFQSIAIGLQSYIPTELKKYIHYR